MMIRESKELPREARHRLVTQGNDILDAATKEYAGKHSL
jgi:hypothetical protein